MLGLEVFGRTLAWVSFTLGLDLLKKSMIPVREGEAKLGGQQLLLVAGQFGPLFGSHGRDGGGSAKLMVHVVCRPFSKTPFANPGGAFREARCEAGCGRGRAEPQLYCRRKWLARSRCCGPK